MIGDGMPGWARALLAGGALGAAGMADNVHHVTMEASRDQGQVVLSVVGRSATPMWVRYEIEVVGASRTRHTGRSQITERRHVLSRVAVPATPPWRATLTVTEPSRPPYTFELTSDSPI